MRQDWLEVEERDRRIIVRTMFQAVEKVTVCVSRRWQAWTWTARYESANHVVSHQNNVNPAVRRGYLCGDAAPIRRACRGPLIADALLITLISRHQMRNSSDMLIPAHYGPRLACQTRRSKIPLAHQPQLCECAHRSDRMTSVRYLVSSSVFSVLPSVSSCFCSCLIARPSATLKKPPISPWKL